MHMMCSLQMMIIVLREICLLIILENRYKLRIPCSYNSISLTFSKREITRLTSFIYVALTNNVTD